MANKKSPKPYCKAFHAFWDTLVGLVEVNMTAYVRYWREGDERLRTGSIHPQHTFTSEDFSATSHGHMVFAKGYLLYSDCITRDQIISMEAWTGSISSNVWILFAFTLVIVNLVVCIEKGRLEHMNSVLISSLERALLGITRLVLRQGIPSVDKGLVLIVIFCHAMTLLTNVYENELTSRIIVPHAKSAMDIFDFLLKGETIAYISTGPIALLTNWLAQQHKNPIPSVKARLVSFQENDRYTLTFGSKPPVFQFLLEHDLKTLLNPRFRTDNCDRFVVKNSIYEIPLFRKFQHALRARFVYMSHLLRENGIDQYWRGQKELEKQLGFERSFRSHNITDISALEGSVISLWNLVPFFIVFVSFLSTALLIFTGENHSKLFQLARRTIQVLRRKLYQIRKRVHIFLNKYRLCRK
jgi:hypothetical protein